MPLSCINTHYIFMTKNYLRVPIKTLKISAGVKLIYCFAPGIPTSPATRPALMATSRRSSARAQLLTGTLMIRLTKSIYILVSGKIFGGNFLSPTKIKVWDLMTFNFWIIFILDKIEWEENLQGSLYDKLHFNANVKTFLLVLVLNKLAKS